MRIAVDIDSTLHHHWPLVAAAAQRRFGVDLPYEEQVASAARVLTDEQLLRCIEDTHADAAIAGARPYPNAVETVNGWYDAGHEIHITSHRAERSVQATRRWLDAIGLHHHALYCGDDKLAYCRRNGIGLLVDDSPPNVLGALGAGMHAAALRHPWNEHVCSATDVVCAAGWRELARALAPVLGGYGAPMPDWPALPTGDAWLATRDTLHAHTQVLGKLAAVLAPPEPQLQHAALRLTARGWETRPLPAPDGSGAFVVALDLHRNEAVAEHSDGREARIALTPDRSVGAVTRDLLGAVREMAGPVTIDPTPQEVSWTVPLDEDEEHARYDTAHVAVHHAAATRAALVLAEFRAAFRGRSTPVNAWWGSFDLAVSLFSGLPAEPPSSDFIMRNAMDSQEVAVGWWPGDDRYPAAAFYAYAHPAPEDFAGAAISPPAARWEDPLGLYVLDWDDARATGDPHAAALEFLHSVFSHACAVCDWDPELAASAAGTPPPVV